MTTHPRRQQILSGLQARIEWCSRQERPEQEIAKLATLIAAAVEKFNREDALDEWWRALEQSDRA